MTNGNLLGLPGRILVAVSGVVVALLSIIGVIIWEKKRRGRRALARAQRARASAQAAVPSATRDARPEPAPVFARRTSGV